MYITVKMKLATACVSLNISFNEGLKRNCFFFWFFFFLQEVVKESPPGGGGDLYNNKIRER